MPGDVASTVPADAAGNNEYVVVRATSGTLTFAPSETSKTVAVTGFGLAAVVKVVWDAAGDKTKYRVEESKLRLTYVVNALIMVP